jgi:hypothetical protein
MAETLLNLYPRHPDVVDFFWEISIPLSIGLHIGIMNFRALVPITPVAGARGWIYP